MENIVVVGFRFKWLITPKLSHKKYYLSMGKAVKYTKVKVIKITEVQYRTLKK